MTTAKKKPTKTKQAKKLTEKSAFFIRDEQGILVVNKNFLKNLSFDDAVVIGLSTLLELRVTMVEDAIMKDDTYIENVKAIIGLNNSLNQLETSFPKIMKHIRDIEPEHSHNKVYYC